MQKLAKTRTLSSKHGDRVDKVPTIISEDCDFELLKLTLPIKTDITFTPDEKHLMSILTNELPSLLVNFDCSICLNTAVDPL